MNFAAIILELKTFAIGLMILKSNEKSPPNVEKRSNILYASLLCS
jgi:hypothetical protein